MLKGRRQEFQRNEKLEDLLNELESILSPVEEKMLEDFETLQFPTLLLIGGPRTGSTVFMQWLASLGVFSYPTNLISRFFYAPYIGAKIQLLLTDPAYSYKNEIVDFNGDITFKSDLGKTAGALAPNDFWYFWRRFIPNEVPRYITEIEEKSIKGEKFIAEIAAIESVFKKPFAMKAMILEQNIPFLSKLFEKAIFINLKRHPFFNIQSLLEARIKFFGDRNKWYSIRPRQYHELVKYDPIKQVAGQVYFKNMAIKEGLSKIDSLQYLEVEYEEYCKNPISIFRKIEQKYHEYGFIFDWEYHGPDKFNSANTVRITAKEKNEIIEAYAEFSGENIDPC